ncbi:MAG: toxic anion resistance protein [Candidatus Dormibacteraeota bacterium]|uniref:Toxic anion resistance protein n=1 Tax=Candidatus Amunia macphersoniae TaxID=3127014 RepID=A0A934KNT4_9BACT|nr:toxic anion resistance protein [Candidatus Dormibacteraeota bacterium]
MPDPTSASAPDSSATAGGAEVSLSLSAPEVVAAVAPEQAEKQVAVPSDAAQRIDSMVSAFVDGIAALDVHGDRYRRRVDDIDTLAEREIRSTSDVSNRLLDRPARAMSGLGDSNTPIAKGLLDLRRSVEDLNPAKHDLSHSGPRKLLGVIPFGDRVRAYFSRYQKSQSHIQGIVGALREGGAELEKDNAAIGQEQKALWTQMETLRQYAYMAEQLDTGLEARIDAVDTNDPDHARVLREDVLFPVRRRRQEILTQLAVAVQGYAALRVVETNNRELIRAVRTATTTTVAALRTAVMVAQALTNQRLVSEQVKAVNEVTSSMIESTSSALRDQTTTVEDQAQSPGLDIASLQRAWDNVFAALDQIDSYKLRALDAMKVTVQTLSEQVERSNAQVERLHANETDQRRVAAGTPSLRLP